MTPEQIDALEAGPETDRLVAEAIDVPLFGAANMDGRTWGPSGNWFDAMWAADKFGLWDSCFFGAHGVWKWEDCDCRYGTVQLFVEDDSGPMAICKAILKLHGDGQ